MLSTVENSYISKEKFYNLNTEKTPGVNQPAQAAEPAINSALWQSNSNVNTAVSNKSNSLEPVEFTMPEFQSNLQNSETANTELEPVEVFEDGNVTQYRNAHGMSITVHTQEDGSRTYGYFSEDDMAVTLKDNPDGRDVLVFSNMGENVERNSQIPNTYYRFDNDDAESSMYFDENQNIVIQLSEEERIVIDGRDGQTVLEGPLEVNYDPADTGNVDVEYTGDIRNSEHQSRGDHVRW